MDIDELLRIAMQWGATDVHLVVPACPVLRLSHELMPMGEAQLTPQAIKEAFGQQEDEGDTRGKKTKGGQKKAPQSEQNDIIARTLRRHSG